MERIKILIVDDHTVVRDGLMSMLEKQEDFLVVGQAVNGLDAVQKVRDMAPDVTLMDLRMPKMGGVEAMIKIGEENSDARFIVLTTYDTET